MAEHVHWLREQSYERALQVLPHDGGQHEKIERRTYESALKDSGFAVKVLQNIGEGAAMIRVNAVRRLLPRWVQQGHNRGRTRCVSRLSRKRDEERNIGVGAKS